MAQNRARSPVTTIAGCTIVVIALVVAFLHIANHFGVRQALCETPDRQCTARSALSSIDLRLRPALPSALRVEDLHADVDTALLRRRCDGGWTAGLGARIDMARATAGELLEVDRSCADVRRDSVRGEMAGARLRIGQCIVRIDTLGLDWHLL